MDRNKKQKLKRKRVLRNVFLGLLVFILFLGVAGVTYGYLSLSRVAKTDLTKDKTELGIDTQLEEKIADKKGIKNIILLGVDQYEGDAGRSDAMIVATIDPIHDKIKLTSLMRDSYVNIPGRGYDKLNHAFAFGKAPLSIKTINQTFGLNIEDYVKVNFTEMEAIIDAVGGIELDVRADELTYINKYIKELSKDKNITPPIVESAGKQTLNGIQAMGYSRIRYTDGGDAERTERHRIVLTKIFDKIASAGPTKLPGMVNKLLPLVETSLSTGDIINLGTSVLSSGNKNLEKERFPLDTFSKGEKINGVYYLTFDEAATKDQIFKYIFEDVKPPKK